MREELLIARSKGCFAKKFYVSHERMPKHGILRMKKDKAVNI